MFCSKIDHIRHRVLEHFNHVGRAVLFFLTILRHPIELRKSGEIVRQLYFLFVKSISLIVVASLFIGMVISLQGYYILNKFGAVSELGQLVALTTYRELAPVVSGLLFAGRAGSSLTSEIGMMVISEQFACIEVMAINAYARILFPRLIAGILSVPLLCIYFNVAALIGGYIVGVLWLGLDAGTYWASIRNHCDFITDVMHGVAKSLVFAVIITLIAIYNGYFVKPSTEGLANAATSTVVKSSLTILLFDFILTSFFLGV